MLETVGLGGGCHWCTEAIFQSLNGVDLVEQGWIASDGANAAFSEAVMVTFNPEIISLQTLIEVHLYTHSSTSNHRMRSKYRSAVYTLNTVQVKNAEEALSLMKNVFTKPIITRVIPLLAFKLNDENFLNYYYSDVNKPFCKNIISPKLKLLMLRFDKNICSDKITLQDFNKTITV